LPTRAFRCKHRCGRSCNNVEGHRRDAMLEEENNILFFLRENRGSAFTLREIAKKAVRRKVFEENPNWAHQPLAALVAKDLVVIDDRGCYSLKKVEGLG
jgi:hypothetical protein